MLSTHFGLSCGHPQGGVLQKVAISGYYKFVNSYTHVKEYVLKTCGLKCILKYSILYLNVCYIHILLKLKFYVCA